MLALHLFVWKYTIAEFLAIAKTFIEMNLYVWKVRLGNGSTTGSTIVTCKPFPSLHLNWSNTRINQPPFFLREAEARTKTHEISKAPTFSTCMFNPVA